MRHFLEAGSASGAKLTTKEVCGEKRSHFDRTRSSRSMLCNPAGKLVTAGCPYGIAVIFFCCSPKKYEQCHQRLSRLRATLSGK